MRVLWYTNILLPDACQHIGRPAARGSGWWMTVLLERLKRRPGLDLAVIGEGGLRDYHFEADGVEYFVLKTPWRKGIRNRLGSYKEMSPIKSRLRKFASIVNDWHPDVVHVHGTESGFGLIKAWGLIAQPTVISIQGLLTPYSTKVYGDLLPAQLHGRLRGAIGFKSQCLSRWKSFRARMPAEEEAIRSADMVLGRTQWDRAWAWAFHPNVRYRHVNELMRPEFREAESWNLAECVRHRIFCTSGGQPLKGLHVLLDAVRRLRQVYPDVSLAVASEGFVPRPQNDYARFVWRLIREWNLEEVVTFLGVLGADGIVERLRQANCYVTPSLIENSCNALQEAMLVGTPCVATYTGGMPTLIEAERTGLMFPTGDAALLAWQVARVFQEDSLAVRLGSEARAVAAARHDPARVEAQLLGAYEELVDSGAVSVRESTSANGLLTQTRG